MDGAAMAPASRMDLCLHHERAREGGRGKILQFLRTGSNPILSNFPATQKSLHFTMMTQYNLLSVTPTYDPFNFMQAMPTILFYIN